MRAIVLVGTVGLFTAPAVAGNGNKPRDAKRPAPVAATVEAPERASRGLAVGDAPVSSASTPSASATRATRANSATGTAPAPQSELVPLAIPELPPDLSSPLVPFPELEDKRPVAHVKRAKPAKAKPPVLRFGEDYVLGGRQSARPTNVDVEHVVPRELTQAQVATVVQNHMSDIQVCWAAVPRHLRADACTVDLILTIAETGAVTDIELKGDMPKHAQKCITSAASQWTFPAAETSTDIAYGVALRSL